MVDLQRREEALAQVQVQVTGAQLRGPVAQAVMQITRAAQGRAVGICPVSQAVPLTAMVTEGAGVEAQTPAVRDTLAVPALRGVYTYHGDNMIYLQIKHIINDRYSVLTIHYPNPYKNPVGNDIIPLDYVINASDPVDGTTMFEIMTRYREYDIAMLKKISAAEYQIDFRIANIRKAKIRALRKHINRHILRKFPVDKQMRHMTFMRLHEQATRTVPEQYIYDIELHGRPEATVWSVVSDNIKWMYDVIDVENNYVDTINGITNIKTLLGLSVNNISLPPWPGGI
jgi:hypothetical protein